MKSSKTARFLGFATGTLLAASAYGHTYSVTDLGTLSTTTPEDTCHAAPTGINDHGYVVGEYSVPYFGGFYRNLGFMWNGESVSELATSYVTPEAGNLSVAGINNHGHIVATVGLPDCYPAAHGGGQLLTPLFLGDRNAIMSLANKYPSQDWRGAQLSGINDNDKIVGTLFMAPPAFNLPKRQAFTYSVRNNKLTKLGIPAPYTQSYGAAINIWSVVAGTVVDGNNHAAWWNGAWHVLPCENCASTGINYWSEIIGDAVGGGFLWTGYMTQLAGTPVAINDSAVIVGYATRNSGPPYYDAAVWFNSGRSLRHLDDLIAQNDPAKGAVHFDKATAINSYGDIAAHGCWTSGELQGHCHQFLLNALNKNMVAQ